LHGTAGKPTGPGARPLTSRGLDGRGPVEKPQAALASGHRAYRSHHQEQPRRVLIGTVSPAAWKRSAPLLGLTRERIRQIEAKTLAELEASGDSQQLADLLD
jgi:hypothetical protein